MTDNAPTKPGFKQKAKQEFKEYFVISAYLAFFFCALVAYTMLLLRRYDVESESMNFTFAIINALIIGKVILIGKMMKLGRGLEARPLYQTVIFSHSSMVCSSSSSTSSRSSSNASFAASLSERSGTTPTPTS